MIPTDGGPAFPTGHMSLRDWFAGLAMAGLVQDRDTQRMLRNDCEDDDELHGKMAAVVYKLADAMLEARRK
jgi:hypothetical protein